MSNDLYTDLYEYTKEKNAPFYVHWEITNACNLSCNHCYLPKSPAFFGYEKSLSLIAYLEELGFLSVGMTGGETLIHPNFVDIYRALKKKGFLVTIFTNGIMIDRSVIEIFKELPPYKLNISIYGTDDASYQKVTQRCLFDKFERNLDLLERNDICFELQTPLMCSNEGEIAAIESYCQRRQVNYKIGTLVYTMVNGCKSNLSERLPAKRVVEYEARDAQSVNNWATAYKSTNPIGESLRCAAGKNSILIDVDGCISICGMLREPKFGFDDRLSFMKALELIRQLRERLEEYYRNGPCSTCRLSKLCLGCPAHSYLENSCYDGCIEYFRDIATEKMEQLKICGLDN
jgi:radical SAM protein with 4Fe4S-binding SPASM domain